jgi:hypothetical protein
LRQVGQLLGQFASGMQLGLGFMKQIEALEHLEALRRLSQLLAEYVGPGVERTTVYVSPVDKALGFSSLLFTSLRRIGQVGPEDLTDEERQHLERVARTQIIDARVPTGFIGHAYFYRHPAVSSDLVLLLRYQLDPGSPGRPLHKRGTNFWQITPDYPGVSDTPGR